MTVNKALIQLFFCVLSYQIVHSVFNLMFPFLLEDLVGKQGQTLHIKSAFDVTRVVLCAVVFPLYGAISDRLGRKALFCWFIIMSLGETACLCLGHVATDWALYIGAKLFSFLSSPYLVFAWSAIADIGEVRLRATHFGIVGAHLMEVLY